MLKKQDVDAEIAALENRENHNATAVARLASLYTIRDHMEPGYDAGYSQAAPPKPQVAQVYGDSEFLRAVSRANSADAWAVMDELMDTLKVSYSKVYDSVMRKIGDL